jgi:hypothetical protein
MLKNMDVYIVILIITFLQVKYGLGMVVRPLFLKSLESGRTHWRFIKMEKTTKVLAINTRFIDKEFYAFVKHKALSRGLKASTFIRLFLTENLKDEYDFYRKQRRFEEQEQQNASS